MKSIYSNSIYLSFLALFVLLIVISFNLFQLQTRYLYFCGELVLLFCTVLIYNGTFREMRWNEPFETVDHSLDTIAGKKGKIFGIAFAVLLLVNILVWIITGVEDHSAFKSWVRMGLWFGFFAVASSLFYFFIRKRDNFFNTRSLIITTLLMVVVLTGFEAVMLHWGHAWSYNHTVMGWVLGIPVENILFVYPVTPAFCIVVYSIITRYRNDLKAFWFASFILVPSAIAVELMSIYTLDLWHIYNDYSVLPMGKVNLEEFFFYAVFLELTLVTYIFFDRNLKPIHTMKQSTSE
ncbi:MAG: hypothetical protein OCD01_09135 [Fibrobacterales bacterium]